MKTSLGIFTVIATSWKLPCIGHADIDFSCGAGRIDRKTTSASKVKWEE